MYVSDEFLVSVLPAPLPGILTLSYLLNLNFTCVYFILLQVLNVLFFIIFVLIFGESIDAGHLYNFIF